MYTDWKKTHPTIKLSESSFRKIIPKEIKKAKKETDKCEQCEKGKNLKRKIDAIENSIAQNYNNLEAHTLLENLKKRQKIYNIHTERKDKQKLNFDNHKNTLTDKDVLFIMDFKVALSGRLALDSISIRVLIFWS